jgi:hypothetical protein
MNVAFFAQFLPESHMRNFLPNFIPFHSLKQSGTLTPCMLFHTHSQKTREVISKFRFLKSKPGSARNFDRDCRKKLLFLDL